VTGDGLGCFGVGIVFVGAGDGAGSGVNIPSQRLPSGVTTLVK